MYSGGAIGDVTMVELTFGHDEPTGAWEYPPPFDLSPSNLAWDTWLKDTPRIPFTRIDSLDGAAGKTMAPGWPGT